MCFNMKIASKLNYMMQALGMKRMIEVGLIHSSSD